MLRIDSVRALSVTQAVECRFAVGCGRDVARGARSQGSKVEPGPHATTCVNTKRLVATKYPDACGLLLEDLLSLCA